MSCCSYISKDPTSSRGWRHLTLRLRPACLGTSGGCGHGVPPTYRRAMDIDSLQRQCWQCWQGWRGWKIECVWIINSKKNRIEPLNQTETYVFRFFCRNDDTPFNRFQWGVIHGSPHVSLRQATPQLCLPLDSPRGKFKDRHHLGA